MFLSIILEVYYKKNKKSGKRSENIMVKKFKISFPSGLDPGTPA